MQNPTSSPAAQGQCAKCLTTNDYSLHCCHACGARLPWSAAATKPQSQLSPPSVTQNTSVPPNDSGTGATATVPLELRRWSWSAFWWNWIWGIGHNSWWTLLCLVPYVNLVAWFICGAKGNEWAWQNRRWDSVQQFRDTQTKWTQAAWVFVLVPFVTISLLTVLGRRVNTVFTVEGNPAVTSNYASPSSSIPDATEQLKSSVTQEINAKLAQMPSPLSCIGITLAKQSENAYSGFANFSDGTKSSLTVTTKTGTSEYYWHLD